MDISELLVMFEPDYSRLDGYTLDKIMDLITDIAVDIEDSINHMYAETDIYIDPAYYIDGVKDAFANQLWEELYNWREKLNG